MAQPANTANRTKGQIRPETSAWLLLLAFFLAFCLIVAGAGYGGWRYYNDATLSLADLADNGIVRVHTNAGVVYQPRGRADLITPRELCADNPPNVRDVCFDLEEGHRVRTVAGAGYGPVASVVLPDRTQIDLWSHPTGSNLMLDTYRVTRWNNRRQEVVIQQDSGYARYDVKDSQPYAQVSYTVQISDGVLVRLAPGGSYSVNVSHADAPALADSGAPLLVEVAARSGSAEVQGPNQRATVGPGRLVQVDRAGVLSAPLPARWQLIRDGDFSDYTQDDYNRGSATWAVAAPQRLPANEEPGAFAVASGCRPESPDLCLRPADRTTIGQFRREGGQREQFITTLTQQLDADVSEYTRSLRFSAWTRVLTQTVEGAGIDGTECPIMITFVYKKTGPGDSRQEQTSCVYTTTSTAKSGAAVQQGYIRYYRIPRFEWTNLQIELRDIADLKEVRYLQEIRIEARGHDYLAEITGVSLVGIE
ncbi:MAG TPA: hypothetical protein VFO07_06680 [Roseiflexaceae bacterium]|nr:hypothetical protein [Roseiflexaceae bacterium]